MISKAVIKKYGLDAASLRRYFTAKVPEPNVARLTQLVADRIKDGRERALSDYRLWAAVDQAYDSPLAQTTPTILRNIMETCDSAESVLQSLRGWGFSEEKLFSKRVVGEKTFWDFNVPLFYNVMVPLVKAYVTIRLSKIFNDRNLTPLLEYPPREFTAENRLLCKILTEVVESLSINFDYSSTLQNFIMNALMYSVAIKFPVEPWFKEKRENEDGSIEIEKEGVRYAIPHVTRTYWDMTYPLHTLNTGTGCAYAGYWTILKWGDVAMDQNLWNKNSVPHGTNWLDPNALWYNYFKEVYPCTLEFPRPDSRRRNDRENMAFRYTRTDFDCAFFLTYHFQQLVPKDWGLGDYPHPVWMRFTIGGDSTVMYAEVYQYHPLDVIQYDPDANRGRNASLALEVIPFQDITGNVFTQLLQTIKRNLQNIQFYDTDVINKDDLESLNKRQNAQYGGLNFIGYSGISMEHEGQTVKGLINQVNFQYADTTQILSGLNTTISLLERVLAMSAQEIGAAASHQQSKKEVELTSSSSSNRLAYTASFIDIGIEAWKRHLAEAVVTHMDGKEVMVTIPTNLPDLAANLQKIGFEFVQRADEDRETAVVKGKLSKLHLVQFVARRSDAVRENDSQAATLMLQTIQTIANNQMFVQIIDPVSLLELLEHAAILGGVDDDFKIRLNQKGVMTNQLAQEEQKIIKQCMDAVEQEVVAPVAKEISDLQNAESQNTQQMAQAMAQLKQQLAQIQQLLGMAPALQSPQASTGGVVGSSQPVAGGAPPSAATPQQGAPLPAQPQAAAAPAQPPMSPAGATTVPNMLVPGNPQHVAVARQYLAKAGGKKRRARELAAQDGYKF